MEKIFIKIILGFWFFIIIINLITSKKTFSENENRFLAKFPKYRSEALLDGTYAIGIEKYIDDHFIFRDYWIHGKSILEYGLGKKENNQIYLGKRQLFAKLMPPNDKVLKRNIEGINALYQYCKLPVGMMLIPSASAIYPQKLPNNAPLLSEVEIITTIYSQIAPEIKTLALLESFISANDPHIFFKTDHHWTIEGAFLAYEIISDALQLPLRTKDSFDIQVMNREFYGTLFSRSGFPFIAPDVLKAPMNLPIHQVHIIEGDTLKDYPNLYFEDFLGTKDKYAYFLGTNEGIVHITTDNPSGQKLLIFKDSYTHSLVPFLLYDYAEIMLVDLRYMSFIPDDFFNLASYDQILFIFSVDEFMHNLTSGKLLHYLTK